MNYVCGFMMSWDMQEFLLIKKTHPEWQAGKLNGIGGKIESKTLICIVPNHYHQIGELITRTWLETEKIIPSYLSNYKSSNDFETPHQAMVREFYEETGIQTPERRWRCFHIEELEYDQANKISKAKIYFFAAFGDETKRQYLGKENDPLFEVVSTYKLTDLYFYRPEEVIYSIPYLIRMIIDLVRSGNFNNINPQGVNSK